MEKVGYSGDPDTMKQDYNNLTAENFQGIASELTANSQVYAVLFQDTEAAFPVVFENERFQVVRVR